VKIERAIIHQLQKVIDPETGADVWRMRLVTDLQIDEAGHVSRVADRTAES
jgi:metal-sulfur cluster biosynthetic enzyme